MLVTQMPRKGIHTRHVSSLSSLAITHHPLIVHDTPSPPQTSPLPKETVKSLKCQALNYFIYLLIYYYLCGSHQDMYVSSKVTL